MTKNVTILCKVFSNSEAKRYAQITGMLEDKNNSSHLGINKLAIAQKEAHETMYWLKVLYGSELINKKYYDELMGDVEELHKILVSSVKTLKEKNS